MKTPAALGPDHELTEFSISCPLRRSNVVDLADGLVGGSRQDGAFGNVRDVHRGDSCVALSWPQNNACSHVGVHPVGAKSVPWSINCLRPYHSDVELALSLAFENLLLSLEFGIVIVGVGSPSYLT